MATELVIVLALVLANGLFAGAEIAILSVRKGRVLERAGAGHRGALAVQALRDQPERFLATVQVGITVVGSAAAVFGGSSIARDLTLMLERAGLGSYAHDVAIALVIAVVSFLSLVLGELVPKSIALRHSETYAFVVSRPLLRLARIARPLVWMLTAASNLVLRMFGDRTSFAEVRMSRDELQQLVEEAAKSGSVDPQSSEIAARALDLASLPVADVMVRRDEIVAVELRASAEEIQRLILEEGHSRMPVYDGDLDRLVGYVTARDVLAIVWEGSLIVVDDIVRRIFAVPLTAHVNVVLREMQARRIQIAAVVDEHGGTAGIVTIEDMMEDLIGDIVKEDEVPDRIIRVESDTTALVAGWVPIRKVNRALGLAMPIGREHTTIAGLCMALAFAVPSVGTRLKAPDGTMIEVVDTSPRRVRMVRLIHHTGRERDRVDG
ncbi:MAG TPA: hemolysin family protein [Kofleriaceae bacterium]|nr:hemolysin family protein [Kofleriaceae bacterium]